MADKKADKQKDAITKALAEANDMTVEEYLWMKKNMEEQRAKRKAAEAKKYPMESMMSVGGMVSKNRKGAHDMRKSGCTVSSVDNRKRK